PLHWKCAKFHEWNSALCDIKKGRWCPQCAGNARLNIDIAKKIAFKKDLAKNIARSRNGCFKLNINIAKEIALKKGGKCLLEKYIDIDSSLLWECNAKLSIEIARNIVTKNKGLCLSETYNGAHTKLKWQCEKKHEWYTTLDRIKNAGTWCPFCPWKRQELCKEIVMKLLGLPSDIHRPYFLKTYDHPLGLELDIYYPQYGFAIEVQ
ncbi:7781_t:CDS:2, partial [Funneliformis geosporum]